MSKLSSLGVPFRVMEHVNAVMQLPVVRCFKFSVRVLSQVKI